jgi:hypothetical protein
MANVQYSQALLQGASKDQIVLLNVLIVCNSQGQGKVHRDRDCVIVFVKEYNN